MFGMFKPTLKQPIAPQPWIDPDTNLSVVVMYHRSAKGMKIRLVGRKPKIRLTLPYGASLERGKRFIKANREWILKQYNKTLPSTSFNHDIDLILFGEKFKLHHTLAKRTSLWTQDGIIHITGPHYEWVEYFKRWLKQQVRTFVEKEAYLYAASLGVRFQRISIKDTTSQWGSCSIQGNLSFSWRLIFAPIEVARYVVIHEVCHLQEMNHSPAFWKLVKSLDPHFQKHRKWLKDHGKKLHAYE